MWLFEYCPGAAIGSDSIGAPTRPAARTHASFLRRLRLLCRFLLLLGLRLPRSLALLGVGYLLPRHVLGDVGHGAGDVGAHPARRQGEKSKLEPLEGFDV